MIGTGLRIPAPFGHSKEAKPIITVNNGTPQSSYDNAGYWSFFISEPDEKGKPSLYGYIDLPGSDNEPDSAYYKAKNSAKEVSMSIMDKYTDGLARTWENAIMHVALVNHPAAPGTKEFEDVPDGSLTVNMSMVYSEDSDAIIPALKTALAEKGIVIPDDSSCKTILRDILVAVSQKTNDATGLPQVPIYMSSTGDDTMPLSKQQAEALVATKTLNPSTAKPFTMEDLGFKEQPALDMSALTAALADKDSKIQQLKTVVTALQAASKNTIKATIQNRINSLKARGLSEAVVATLQPQLEFEMSLTSDGNINAHPLEVTLSALEQALPPEVKGGGNDPLRGTYTPPNPYSASELSDADMDKSIDEILNGLV